MPSTFFPPRANGQAAVRIRQRAWSSRLRTALKAKPAQFVDHISGCYCTKRFSNRCRQRQHYYPACYNNCFRRCSKLVNKCANRCNCKQHWCDNWCWRRRSYHFRLLHGFRRHTHRHLQSIRYHCRRRVPYSE